MASEPGHDTAASQRPAPDARPVEAILGKNIAKRALFVAPPLIAVFAVVGGWLGAVSSAIGIGIVLANFVVGGYLLATAAGISLSLYHAAALFGFFIRLGLITLTMVLVVSVADIDRLALGVSAVVSYLVLLSLEAIAVVNGSERELEWTN